MKITGKLISIQLNIKNRDLFIYNAIGTIWYFSHELKETLDETINGIEINLVEVNDMLEYVSGEDIKELKELIRENWGTVEILRLHGS